MDPDLAADVDDAIDVTRNGFVRGVLKSLACELESTEERVKRLRRRVGFLKRLISGAVCSCIYCGQAIDREDVNHWAVCPNHPATSEVIRLNGVVESQRDAIGRLHALSCGLVEQVKEKDSAIRRIIAERN